MGNIDLKLLSMEK